MRVGYVCPLIKVADIVESREFYENVLKQEVEVDHGANIAFKGGFAIHDVEHFQGLTGQSLQAKWILQRILWNCILNQRKLKSWRKN